MGKSAALIVLLAGAVWLLVEVFGGPTASTEWVDLTRVSVDMERRGSSPIPAAARVEKVEGGLATLRLPLTAAEVLETRTLPGPTGTVRLSFWKLPVPPVPELLSHEDPPRLASLDYPRLVDATTTIAEPPAFFLGDWPELGSVLMVVETEESPVLERVDLVYSIFAADGFGDERFDFAAAELLTTELAEGDKTAISLAIPTNSVLRLAFDPFTGGALRGRLVSRDAKPFEAVIASDVGELWRGSIPAEGRTLDVRLPDEAVEQIEVRARASDLAFVENPRLTPLESSGDRSNVLMVVIDTLRADRMVPEKMPKLSAFRDTALSFEQCWSTSSWTLPSVTTLLTSNHGGQHRAWLNDQTLGLGIETLGEAFQRAGYRTAAITGGIFVSQTFGLDRGFHSFDSTGGGVERVVEHAERWIEEAGAEPWFLIVHTYEVHAPYEPPEEAAQEILSRYPGVLGDRPPEPNAFYDRVGPENIDLLRELYDAEAHFADAVLGSFLDRLGEAGRLERAVVAVTSDHGEEFGEHGLLGHTDTLYSEQLAVPFLLRLPGGERGGERRLDPVSHLDFAPTLLDAAGLSEFVPDSFVGVSLLGDADPSPIFASRNIAEVGLLYAYREGDWSLIDGSYLHPREAQGRELYDLRADPGQRNNRAGTGSLPSLWERLGELVDVYGRARAMPRAVDSPAVLRELMKAGYVGADLE